jgi:tetratricopeptide (TPR) repeat protein
MHTLVQAVVSSSIAAEERRRWRGRIATALVACAPADVADRTTRERWELLAPHVAAVASHYRAHGGVDLAFIDLIRRTSSYLASRASFPTAIALMEDATALLESDTACSPVALGGALTELGTVLEQAGRLKEAMAAQERAVALLRPYEDATALAWQARALAGLGSVLTCHYGVMLWKPAELAEAEDRFVRALDVMKSFWGEQNPVYARTLAGLGQVRQDRGDLQGGLACFQRSLGIVIAVYGGDHPDVGHTYDRLGYVLTQTGYIERARECFQQSILILERSYGADAVALGWPHSNLAMLLLSVGELEAALAEQSHAHRIFAAADQDSPPTLISAWRLARIRLAMGQSDRAVATLEPALFRLRSQLGEAHGDVIAMTADLRSARARLEAAC